MLKTSTQQLVCTPQQLREVEQYVRTIEADLHRARQEIERIRNARTLRLARALRGAQRRPLAALREAWQVLRSPPAKRPASKAKHRQFALFRSPAFVPTASDTDSFWSVPAEIAEYCGSRPVVTLHGIGPHLQPAWQTGGCAEVTPADYEIRIEALAQPVLLIDLNERRADSTWSGAFDTDDMRVNMALAALLDLVRARRGRVVMAAVEPGRQPPLYQDFAARVTVVASLVDFDPNAESEE